MNRAKERQLVLSRVWPCNINCLKWALNALCIKFTLWRVACKVPPDLTEHCADPQAPHPLHAQLQHAQPETHCPPSQIVHAFSLVSSLLTCPPSYRFSCLPPAYSSGLNLGLPSLKANSNNALPPCGNERDKGESRNSQTCRVKGCSSSQ